MIVESENRILNKQLHKNNLENMARLKEMLGWQQLEVVLQGEIANCQIMMESAATGDEALKAVAGYVAYTKILMMPGREIAASSQRLTQMEEEEKAEAPKAHARHRNLP